jgi:hypothetical protein
MGRKIVLDAPFTGAGASFPKIYDDRILTPGSLMLLDMSHSAGGAGTSGAPTHGLAVPNIAATLGLAATGQTGYWGMSWSNGPAAFGASDLVERTAKGGVHGIYGQSVNTNRGLVLTSGSGTHAAKAHIAANPNNDLYVSVWGRTTRPTILAGNVAPQAISAIAPSSGTGAYYLTTLETLRAGGTPPSALTNDGVAGNLAGNWRRSLRTDAWVGAATPEGAFFIDPVVFGCAGAWGGFNTGKAPSWIFYRYYLEDLTLSGRTFVQVDAIDKALYAEAFGVGGKFANDTFTDPATKP